MSAKIERSEWLIAIVYAVVFQAILLYFVGFSTTPYSPWDVVAGLARMANMSDMGFRTPALTGMQWLSMATLILFYLVGPVLLFQATVKRIRDGSGHYMLVIGMVLTVGTIPYNTMSILMISKQMAHAKTSIESSQESMRQSIEMGNLGFDAVILLTAGTPPADITLESLPSYDEAHSGKYQLGLTDDGKLMLASTVDHEKKMVLTPPNSMEWDQGIRNH